MSWGWVYFVQAGDEFGPIKIGHTTQDPQLRLKQLQTGSWLPLRLLHWEEGGQELERAYHLILRHQRLEGEWFRAGPLSLCVAGHLTPESLQECWDRVDAEVEARKAAAA